MQVILKNLPKISLNEWYAGSHWTKRQEIKDQYKLIIRNQFKNVLSKDNYYHVNYDFRFKSKPLDATNCVAMLKLIEDLIFEDDSYKIIHYISITSTKYLYDEVVINIKTF